MHVSSIELWYLLIMGYRKLGDLVGLVEIFTVFIGYRYLISKYILIQSITNMLRFIWIGFVILKTTNKTTEQDSPKKKEVNWQESVEKVEGITEPTPVVNDEPAAAASTVRKESLQRKDSNVGAGKVEGAGQTGTAKRKKKKKEEVM